MNVRIDVTQKDIDEGAQGRCEDCPVTLALQRVVPDARVYSSRFFTFDGYLKAAPPAVHRFIYDFDLGKPVQPFSFPLDIPKRFLKETADA